MIQSWLADWYLWLKAFHVISMIAWMAGMFYLPRLFVYHCQVQRGSAESERLKVMERRLLKQIINPAMIATWVFGLLLVASGLVDHRSVWFGVKFVAVLAMSGVHGAMTGWRRAFMEDRNTRSHKYYRVANEVPTILMFVIVIMVIVKPF